LTNKNKQTKHHIHTITQKRSRKKICSS